MMFYIPTAVITNSTISGVVWQMVTDIPEERALSMCTVRVATDASGGAQSAVWYCR